MGYLFRKFKKKKKNAKCILYPDLDNIREQIVTENGYYSFINKPNLQTN